jgi:NadR type nicotinamide-nucleotide adenylyltransferase
VKSALNDKKLRDLPSQHDGLIVFLRSMSSFSNIKKVCIIGPECTGKTVLSETLARHLNTVWVEEYARAYLNRLNQPYEEADLIKIAHGQVRMEDEWVKDANRVLVCDTNLIVIKVWSEFKYGHCAKEILNIISERKYDLYLLTYIDIPWIADPLREHPDRREELYNIYLKEMKGQQVPFVEIKGTEEQRLKSALAAVDQYILSKHD